MDKVNLNTMVVVAVTAPFTKEEIWSVVKGMSSYKAPGIDGFHLEFFSTDVMHAGIKDTLLMLIVKKKYGRMGRMILLDLETAYCDPISTYLFVLFLEHLSHLVGHSVMAGQMAAYSSLSECPNLSYLFF
ncbi:hypothetical protein V2J09_015922 [Rumex salicifolius]